MKKINSLIFRNIKMFFKDKGLFFVALITPLILLVLYTTFLGNVYRDSFVSTLPQGVTLSDNVINGLVGGQLLSSLLAVCPITVAFCSNMLMVQDKISGAKKDFLLTPTKKSTMALSYYISTTICTLIISLFAMVCCFIYLAIVGWYLSFIDVLALVLDVFLLTMFGTALSSIINHFLSTQGQISAVGSIVSSCYGFICGAYMPISTFGTTLQSILGLLPGTYGTALLRNHSLGGVFSEMTSLGIPTQVIDGLKSSIDCNISLFGANVSIGAMYAIMATTVIVLVGAYILINYLKKPKKHTQKQTQTK